PLSLHDALPIYRAGAFVGVDGHACTGSLRVDQLQSGGNGSSGEEPLAIAEHQREEPKPVLVDEIVFDQGLNQVATAVHLDLAPGLILKRGDRLSDVSLDESRVVPRDFFEGP